MMLECHRYIRNLTNLYGNKSNVCPSPLLSALIAGCVESGRDLVDGGADFHIFSPLLVGVSNAANSLHVIEKLVFREREFTLTELASCMASDWSHRLFNVAGHETTAFGQYLPEKRIKAIREQCLAEPKFGNGVKNVDRWAWWLLKMFDDCVHEAHAVEVHRDGLRQA